MSVFLKGWTKIYIYAVNATKESKLFYIGSYIIPLYQIYDIKLHKNYMIRVKNTLIN
jgi:hypothetical protein